MRQQLQQHLRNAHSALRGYGDYLRRNLKLILELSQDPTPSSGDPGGVCQLQRRAVALSDRAGGLASSLLVRSTVSFLFPHARMHAAHGHTLDQALRPGGASVSQNTDARDCNVCPCMHASPRGAGKLSARELDRVSFLFKPYSHSGGGRLSGLVPQFHSSTTLTVEQVGGHMRT
jgi:hypothetical protein